MTWQLSWSWKQLCWSGFSSLSSVLPCFQHPNSPGGVRHWIRALLRDLTLIRFRIPTFQNIFGSTGSAGFPRKRDFRGVWGPGQDSEPLQNSSCASSFKLILDYRPDQIRLEVSKPDAARAPVQAIPPYLRFGGEKLYYQLLFTIFGNYWEMRSNFDWSLYAAQRCFQRVHDPFSYLMSFSKRFSDFNQIRRSMALGHYFCCMLFPVFFPIIVAAYSTLISFHFNTWSSSSTNNIKSYH